MAKGKRNGNRELREHQQRKFTAKATFDFVREIYAQIGEDISSYRDARAHFGPRCCAESVVDVQARTIELKLSHPATWGQDTAEWRHAELTLAHVFDNFVSLVRVGLIILARQGLINNSTIHPLLVGARADDAGGLLRR